MAWREQLAALPNPPAVCVTEVPLLYEVGADDALRQGRRDHGAAKLREARRGGWKDDREARLLPDREKVEARGLHVREHGTPDELDAWVAEVMATLTAGRLTLVVARAVPRRALRCRCSSFAGAAPGSSSSEPDWYLRTRYPLEYEHIVRSARAELRPRPGAPRRGRLRREPVRPERALRRGRGRPDAAPSGDGAGASRSARAGRASSSPISATRRSTSATAPGTSTTCATTTAAT